MSHSSQTCLHTTKYEWYCIFEVLSYEITVLNDSTVWSAVIYCSWGKIILFSKLFSSCIVCHHTIYQSPTNTPKKLRLSKPSDIISFIYIRLSNHPHTIPSIHKQFAHYGYTIVWSIYIGITTD